jgi:hypothetical protein
MARASRLRISPIGELAAEIEVGSALYASLSSASCAVFNQLMKFRHSAAPSPPLSEWPRLVRPSADKREEAAMTAATTMATGRAKASAAVWTGRVLSGLFAAFMLMDLGMKLARLPIVEETGQKIGLPPGSGFGIGVGELILLALYLYPRTSILGAILFTGLFGGTAAVHWIHGDPLFSHILFGVYLGVLAWGGLWLRDERLRAMFPVRSV